MTTLAIRKSLHEYIRFADEKKVKALFTIVEDEIKEKQSIWTKEFTNEMKKRAHDLETKKTKGNSWENVQSKAKAILKNGK
jgi:hypothetical protein